MQLAKKVEQFKSKKNSLLDELAAIDAAVLSRRPKEGEWSVIEIVEHMVLGEREVLMGLPEAANLRRYDRTFKNKLMLKVVMFVLGRFKVKVPSKRMVPKGGGDLADLRARWDESQQWLTSYIEQCSATELDHAVFKHPVSGPINVPQVVDLGIAHLDAHTEQIRNVLRSLGR